MHCRQCAAPMDATHDHPCPLCAEEAPAFTETHTAFLYTPPLDMLIQGWKYKNKSHWTGPLAKAWLGAMPEMPSRPLAFVPVPLHWRRLLERGYNQAGLLAQTWGKILDIPVLHHHARRQRHTHKQSLLGNQDRQHNIHDAFRVRPLPYRHVAIVDDVMTSGSTARALAKALRDAGAEQVDLWVLARAQHGQ